MLLLIKNQQLIKTDNRKVVVDQLNYEARAPGATITPYRGINELHNRLKLIDTGIAAVNVSPPNQESLPTVATSYGHVPVGSILSNQCCMMPFDFQVFSTVSVAFYGLTVTQVYPPFPFSTNIN